VKRGQSGLSLVVGIDKPVGMSSHDVVNRCRRIFGEKRVGHTGTLDPAASGVLAICVGPATRLDAYLDSDTKTYTARVVFGQAMDTDDAEGTVIRTAPVPERLHDPAEAQRVLAGIVGPQSQMPPSYSAIKVNGVKGYEAARKGKIIDLKPRPVNILSAEFLGLGEDDAGRLFWDASFTVSKGTYIRSIARDLGASQGTAAHLGALRRTRCGRLDLSDCVTLQALEENPGIGRLDPVRLLGHRVLFATEQQARAVANGGPLPVPASANAAADDPDGLALFAVDASSGAADAGGCLCIGHVRPDLHPLAPGEIISVVSDNKLVALYGFDSQRGQLRSRCVFSQGVSRGSDIYIG
jgi:tRNA pseudouridine55 synthase